MGTYGIRADGEFDRRYKLSKKLMKKNKRVTKSSSRTKGGVPWKLVAFVLFLLSMLLLVVVSYLDNRAEEPIFKPVINSNLRHVVQAAEIEKIDSDPVCEAIRGYDDWDHDLMYAIDQK